MQDLVEEANMEYTMLLTTNVWGPSGKPDSGDAPALLVCTKTEINNLVQNQVSTMLKQ